MFLSPTSASSRDLARRLSEHFSPHLPSNTRLESEDGLVVVIINGVEDSRAGAALILSDDDGRPMSDLVETATLNVLGHVQDRLALDTTEPWPARAGQRLPLPEVRVEGRLVHAWFGDRSAPTLAVAPFSVPTDSG